MSKPCEKCGGTRFKTVTKRKRYQCRKCKTVREDIVVPIEYVVPLILHDSIDGVISVPVTLEVK